MEKEKIYKKIINYIEEQGKATMGDVYIRFHMMNKGNEFSKEGDMPISAAQVAEYLEELIKTEKIIRRDEYFYLK